MNVDSEKSRRALILIDFQRDFLDDGGRMPAGRAQVPAVLEAAHRAVAAARAAGDLVVAIGNEFRPGDLLMNLLRRGAAISGSEGARWTGQFPATVCPIFPNGPAALSSIRNWTGGCAPRV
jgi:nicotinamidase-related amidase